MADATIFPAVIRASFDRNGAFAEMAREAEGVSSRIKERFEKDFADIGRSAQTALSLPRLKGGALDLDIKGMERGVEAAKALAQAQREIANAARTAANADSKDNPEPRLRQIAKAAEAKALAYEHDARAAEENYRAHQLLNSELQKAQSAVKGVYQQAGIGTTANHALVNSTRAVRTAMLQAGQQAQDTAISIYSGQKASVVFAQQLPQLAFALSGLEGSANKTHDRIGRFATFLSGPWGLAVGLGVGVLAQLVSGLFSAGDASDKTGSATSRLKDKLDLSKNSYSALIEVVNEYNKSQERTEELTLASAEAAKKEAAELLKKARAQLAVLESINPKDIAFAGGDNPLGAVAGYYGNIGRIEGKITELEKGLRDAAKTVIDIENKGRLDQAVAIQQAADRELRILTEKYDRKLVGEKEYQRRSLEIQRKAEADKEALRESKKKSSSGTGGLAGQAARDASIGEMTAIIQRLFPGARITASKDDHSKYTAGGKISDHFLGRAIDFVPGGGMGKYTTAEVEQILEDAGIDIRRNRSGTKQIFGPGRSADRPGDHNDHFHVAWNGSPNADRIADAQIKAQERAAEKAKQVAEETARIAEFGREAGVSIQAMSDRFNEVPQAVLQSRAALEQIDDLIGQLGEKKPPGFEDKIKQLEALRPAAQALAVGPFRDMLRQAGEQRQVQELLIQGRTVEAEVLQIQLGKLRENKALTEDQLAAVRAMVVADRELTRQREKQNELRQREVALISQTEDNIRQTTYNLLKGGGFGSIVEGLKGQWDLVLQNMADSIVDQVFGDFFDIQREKAQERMFPGVRDASTAVAEAANRAAAALDGLTAAAQGGGKFSKIGLAVNDNVKSGEAKAIEDLGEIIVTGQRQAAKAIRETLNTGLRGILGEQLYAKLGSTLSNVAVGAAYGQLGGGLVGKNNLGAVAGGIAGQALVGSLTKNIASTTLKNVLGSAIPIVGGLIGGLLGGLFSKAKTGSASVSNGSISLGGNNADAKNNSNSIAGQVQASLNRIAEALGGTIGDYAFTVGSRKDEFRVSGSAGANVTSKNPSGLIYRGKDATEAARVALLNAIQDGAVKGIRQGAQRLIAAGKDIEAQLAKAVKFQNVFDELKRLEDPLGYELEKLYREFEGLIGIFREAGASTEEYGQLEKLYGLKRAEIYKQQAEAARQANEQIAASLKSLIDELEIGDSGLSLRDRLGNARAAFDPLAEAIRGGGSVDYDKFTEAAWKVIDITRQIHGSQKEYFDTFNDVLGLSKQALAGVNNVNVISDPGGNSPFGPAASNDNTPVVDAITKLGYIIVGELGGKLDAVNSNLGAIIQAGLANGTILPPAYNFSGSGFW